MLQFSAGEFRIEMALGPSIAAPSAELVERFDQSPSASGGLLTIAAWVGTRPALVVAQRFSPGPEAGFRPAVHVTQAGILFVGAGERLLAYDLQVTRRLWEDTAEMGFWGWAQHGDVVLMSAELELAAWSTAGDKLWTTFVEPPWVYAIDGEDVVLDLMGTTRRFALRTGP